MRCAAVRSFSSSANTPRRALPVSSVAVKACWRRVCASPSERTPGDRGATPQKTRRTTRRGDQRPPSRTTLRDPPPNSSPTCADGGGVREPQRAHTGGTGGSPPENTKDDPARRPKAPEQSRPESVELWGFEPQTSSMPWRRATNCAIAPCGSVVATFQPYRIRGGGTVGAWPARVSDVERGKRRGDDFAHIYREWLLSY